MLQIRKSWKGSRESRSNIGDEVVSWFNELDRKQHTIIVLVVSAKSPNESISFNARRFSLQRRWSLVLCSDACDSCLVLVLLLMENKENVPNLAQQTVALGIGQIHYSENAV